MTWSIQQVARMSGVTSRTLRYYDEIGLLRPDSVGANGYRYYERAQVLRLQQILLLRQMGLDLSTIRAVVDAEHDPIEALRRHHRRLLDERGRLDQLAQTVAATIKHLEKGTEMPAENLFQGFEFNPDYIDRELQRTNEPELGEIKKRTANWSEEDFQSFNDQGVQLETRLLALLRAGVAHDDAATLAVIEDDLELQKQVWTPDKPGYIALAESLTEPSEWHAHMDSLDPRLAAYLRDAMLAYANARM
jgi:MerR family transcriptional regulator, thiopeptide resistance regulator